MNKQELEILKGDFRDWLTHPTTKRFVEIITKESADCLEIANGRAFYSYAKKELDAVAVSHYGKAHGINIILQLIEDCKANKNDDISLLINGTFGEGNE